MKKDTDLPNMLRRYRERLGREMGLEEPLSQSKTAARLGINRRSWEAWECGRRQPSEYALRWMRPLLEG